MNLALMDVSIQSLVGDHREIETVLDCIADGLPTATIDMDAFRRVHQLCLRHYEREEAFLGWLGAGDIALAAKLRGQHEEALEPAERLEEAVLAASMSDAIYLLRRFLAITQHNMIEEERDVFPLRELREPCEPRRKRPASLSPLDT